MTARKERLFQLAKSSNAWVWFLTPSLFGVIIFVCVPKGFDVPGQSRNELLPKIRGLEHEFRGIYLRVFLAVFLIQGWGHLVFSFKCTGKYSRVFIAAQQGDFADRAGGGA